MKKIKMNKLTELNKYCLTANDIKTWVNKYKTKNLNDNINEIVNTYIGNVFKLISRFRYKSIYNRFGFDTYRNAFLYRCYGFSVMSRLYIKQGHCIRIQLSRKSI